MSGTPVILFRDWTCSSRSLEVIAESGAVQAASPGSLQITIRDQFPPENPVSVSVILSDDQLKQLRKYLKVMSE